jgi:ubiquitin carboxyl-terminal hydrolase 10
MRARALVNNGNTCFANAVLQLLVYSPQFWNLFRELGDLKGLRGAGGLETGGGATPLVDVTVRFFEEFMFKGKELPPTQQLPRQTTGGKLSEDEEAEYEHKAVDSFEPIYIYDAMKEKRQLKKLLVGARATNPPAVTD